MGPTLQGLERGLLDNIFAMECGYDRRMHPIPCKLQPKRVGFLMIAAHGSLANRTDSLLAIVGCSCNHQMHIFATCSWGA